MGCFSVAGRPSRSATGAAAAGPAAATNGNAAPFPLTDKPALAKPAGGTQIQAARQQCGGPSQERGEKVEEAIRTRRRPEAREGGSGRMRRGTSRRCGGGGDPRGGDDVGAGHLGGAGREGARVGGGVTCL